MDSDERYFEEGKDEMPTQPVEVTKEVKSGKFGAFMGGLVLGVLFACVCISVTAGIIYGTRLKSQSKYEHVELETQSAEPADLRVKKDGLINQSFIDKLASMEYLIDSRFYLHDIDDEALRDGMLKGMVAALDDVYSEYYTPKELEDLLSDSAGTYYGIGAYVSMDEETKCPKVSGVIKNSPAEAAELRANDILYKIGDVTTTGMSLSDCVALIKGEEGTEVKLTIVRDKKTMEFTVKRAKVETPTVEHKMLEDDMAYIQITEFDDITTSQFAQALEDVRSQGMKGLIIDLRSNPGGNLTTVVDISKMLLPKGLIVYTEDKQGKRSTYECDGKHPLEVPLVVLVDGNSASASEILSGAIQDYGIGTLVGTTTFGKGIVQSVMSLADGSAMKLTISSYYTPNGRNIHGTGIEPDVVCEFDGDAYYDSKGEKDNQLDKGIEVLRELMEKQPAPVETEEVQE